MGSDIMTATVAVLTGPAIAHFDLIAPIILGRAPGATAVFPLRFRRQSAAKLGGEVPSVEPGDLLIGCLANSYQSAGAENDQFLLPSKVRRKLFLGIGRVLLQTFIESSFVRVEGGVVGDEAQST